MSVQKIEQMITQLNVEFDQNAIKSINEICKCEPIEGVSNSLDEMIDDKSQIKFSNNIGPLKGYSS